MYVPPGSWWVWTLFAGEDGQYLSQPPAYGHEHQRRMRSFVKAVAGGTPMMHIGIDPGLSGVLAILAADGALVALRDVPMLTLASSCDTRHAYDVPGMVALLAPYAGLQTHG